MAAKKQRVQAIDLEPGSEIEDLGTVTFVSATPSGVRVMTSSGFDDVVAASKLFVLAEDRES